MTERGLPDARRNYHACHADSPSMELSNWVWHEIPLFVRLRDMRTGATGKLFNTVWG